MEVGLLTLLVNLAILMAFANKKPIVISLVLALAILVRLDALIAAVLITVYIFTKDKRSAIVPATAIIVTTLGILWFQQVYFGSVLPITYYQKVTGFSALDRIRIGILVFNQFAARDTLFLFLFSFAGLFFYKAPTQPRSAFVDGDFPRPMRLLDLRRRRLCRT